MLKLLCLLATLSILVLSLTRVMSQEDSRSSRESQSTSDGNTTLPTEIDPATFCSMVFNNIGPFCQFVVPDNGPCLKRFSDTTCDSCRNILNSCGTYDGDIHSSSLASSCPQSEEFLMDYCSVVDGTYINMGSGSGGYGPVTEFSGSGSTSGHSGSTSGDSGSTSGDGGEEPEAGGLSGNGGSEEPQVPANPDGGIDIDTGDTGPPPSTPVSQVCLLAYIYLIFNVKIT